MQTGAALIPAHTWFTEDGWGLRMHPPVDTSSGDIGAITQVLADHFAAGIAEYPGGLAHAATAVAGRSVR